MFTMGNSPPDMQARAITKTRILQRTHRHGHGLEPNTRYYFAVSAYNGLESACSNEVSAMTPASSV